MFDSESLYSFISKKRSKRKKQRKERKKRIEIFSKKLNKIEKDVTTRNVMNYEYKLSKGENMMKLDVYLDFEKVNSVEEATHILALKDYGEIKKGEIVEIFQVADIVYVYDMGADEENELLNEADQNFLYKVNKRIL